jgi:hypothetical protein
MLFMGILFWGISIYMFVMANEIAVIIAAVVTFIIPLSLAVISTRMLVLNFKTGTVYARILGNKAKSRLNCRPLRRRNKQKLESFCSTN